MSLSHIHVRHHLQLYTSRFLIFDVGVLIEAEEAGNVSSFIQEASFARAPLNSRITPLLPSTTTAREGGGGAKINGSSKGKGKSRAEDDELKRAPVEVQEALILDDLLHVLMVSECSSTSD